MRPDRTAIEAWRISLPEISRTRLRLAAEKIVEAKQKGRAVVAVTGSGPNVHEGVTTLIAELMHRSVIDGVITSSAVVAHEMAGTLDKVKRVNAAEHPELRLDGTILPRGDTFEVTLLSQAQREELAAEIEGGWERYDRVLGLPGSVIIKAAGNMAWPMGLRTEKLAREAEWIARDSHCTLERVAGLGADPRTMIGAGARLGLPVLVSIPQLVGGGAVGLSIGDALPISQRARLIANLLGEAAVIIESAIALSQEIHDGPFETYTGHGIWATWENCPSYSLRGKTLVRIDLDPNLELAWQQERGACQIQRAVDEGLPKTKLTGIPFRMEMSGFARLEGSIPVTADIGVAWPILAYDLEEALGIYLDFLSAPQETPEGRRMREWIVDSVRYVDRAAMLEKA